MVYVGCEAGLGFRASLGAAEKRKIFYCYRESNSDSTVTTNSSTELTELHFLLIGLQTHTHTHAHTHIHTQYVKLITHTHIHTQYMWDLSHIHIICGAYHTHTHTHIHTQYMWDLSHIHTMYVGLITHTRTIYVGLI